MNPQSPKIPDFLLALDKRISVLPDTVPEASPMDLLAGFSGDPKDMVTEAMEKMSPDELWEEFVNRQIKAVFFNKTAEDLVPLLQ